MPVLGQEVLWRERNTAKKDSNETRIRKKKKKHYIFDEESEHDAAKLCWK